MDPHAAPPHDGTGEDTVGVASPSAATERAGADRRSHHTVVALSSLTLSRGAV
jgi:hypothetical protein